MSSMLSSAMGTIYIAVASLTFLGTTQIKSLMEIELSCVCMCLWSQMLTCVSSSVALDTSRQGLSRQLEFTALARFARDPVHPASPSFHMGAGDLNCGPHACTADTFPVEPSPQPQRAAACLTLYVL